MAMFLRKVLYFGSIMNPQILKLALQKRKKYSCPFFSPFVGELHLVECVFACEGLDLSPSKRGGCVALGQHLWWKEKGARGNIRFKPDYRSR